MTDKKFLAILSQADAKMRATLNAFITELAKVGIDYSQIDADKLFRFSDYKSANKDVERIVQKYSTLIEKQLETTTEKAMRLSYTTAAKAVSELNLPTNVFAQTFNSSVVDSFKAYRDNQRRGLNLSQRVWNYTQQCKAEFEMAMSECIEDGIRTGTGAEALARKVRDKLKRPNEMYRRYHLRKLQSDGTVKDVIEWRRRTIDADGKVHFTSTDIEKVGRGVYRSSRQNALRLAATEINMAYKYADNQRMNADKFTRGYEIRLSNNHPEYDICDELQGVYPKDFLFTQWHPRCRCSVIPIVCSLQERLDYLELSEEQQAAWQPKEGYITEYPRAFIEYVGDNADAFRASMSNNTGAYFIRDNKAIIQAILKEQK